jgi:hypothetical protein
MLARHLTRVCSQWGTTAAADTHRCAMFGVELATTQIAERRLKVGERLIGFGYAAEPQAEGNRVAAAAYSAGIRRHGGSPLRWSSPHYCTKPCLSTYAEPSKHPLTTHMGDLGPAPQRRAGMYSPCETRPAYMDCEAYWFLRHSRRRAGRGQAESLASGALTRRARPSIQFWIRRRRTTPYALARAHTPCGTHIPTKQRLHDPSLSRASPATLRPIVYLPLRAPLSRGYILHGSRLLAPHVRALYLTAFTCREPRDYHP